MINKRVKRQSGQTVTDDNIERKEEAMKMEHKFTSQEYLICKLLGVLHSSVTF